MSSCFINEFWNKVEGGSSKREELESDHTKANFTHRIRTISGLYTTSVKQEADRVRGLALPLAEGIHQLLKVCCTLDLEENLIVVVGNLNVKVFADRCFRLFLCTRAAVLVGSRHLC